MRTEQKMKNADKIRNMTIEELAEISVYAFTYMTGYRADTIFRGHDGVDYSTKEDAMLAEIKWLNSEEQ